MGNEKLKNYVEFFFQKNLSNFSYDCSVQKIESRDSKITLPKDAFAYRFFDRQETIAEDGEILEGKPRNYSGKYYLGKLISLNEVKREFPYEKTLVDIMERNKWNKIVKTKYTFQAFEKDDKILE